MYVYSDVEAHATVTNMATSSQNKHIILALKGQYRHDQQGMESECYSLI